MTDKQLTVAELLAKAGKEGASSNQRTRRRRSIEDGGVTVAELTGRIPKVDAKPAEAKHSNQPLDAEPVTSATASEASKTDEAGYDVSQPHGVEPTPEVASEPQTPARSTTFGGNTAADLEQTTQWSIIDNESPQDFDEPIPTSQPAQATPPSASETPVPKPTLKPVMKPAMKPAMAEPVASEPAVEEPEQESPAVTYVVVGEESEAEPEVATTGVTKPVPSSDETIVLSVVSEDDPVRLTTGSFPVVTSEQFFEAPVADLAKNPTVVFQEETPAPSPLDDAVAQAMEQGQAELDEHGFDDPELDEHEFIEPELGEPDATEDYPKTEVMPAATIPGATQQNDYVVEADDDAEYYDEDFAEPQDGQYEEYYDDEYTESEYNEANYEPETGYEEHYLDDGYVSEYTDEYVEEYDDQDTVAEDPEDQNPPAVSTRAAATMIGEEEEPLEKMSIIAVIGMAIAGILVGAALFIGFQYLWASMDKKIVAALGLAVTIALVTIVRVMRTSRDGLSMALTGLVGLVMTFGPLIIVGW